MPRRATIRRLPQAFGMMEAMQVPGVEWGEDYRHAGALVLKEVPEGRIASLLSTCRRRRSGCGKRCMGGGDSMPANPR